MAGSARQLASAARLAGAAATWRIVHDEPRHLHHRDVVERLAGFRNDLGDGIWTTAYAEGERLSTDKAVSLAYEVITELKAELTQAPAGLTAREVDVLRLVAVGLSS